MAKIKVCFVVSDLNQGGAERQLVELIKHIDKDKFSVTLLVYKQETFFYSSINEIPNIQIITNKPTSGNRLSKTFVYGFYLYRFFSRHKFDIVHTMLYHNSVLIRTFLPPFYTGRIVYGVRNNMDLLFSKGNELRKFIEQRLFFRSYVVCNTSKAAESFAKLFKGKKENISYVYNGYDTQRFHQKRTQERDDNSLTVGMVGRHNPQKNYLQALEAIKAIPQIELHIYGAEGKSTREMRDYLQTNNLKDRVTLHAPSNKIEEIYPNFDVLLMTSKFEGCPNVIFEAMLSRVPVIISSEANTDDFVVDHKNGLVYDGENTQELQNELESFSSLNQSDVSKMVETAYIYANNNFSVSAMVDKYSSLYEEINSNHLN